MTTRAEFVARIRAEVRRTAGLVPAEPAPRPADPAAAVEALRRELAERWPEALARFAREFERVGGVLHRVATAGEAPGLVARIARERGLASVVTWPAAALGADLGEGLAAAGLRTDTLPGEGAGAAERERVRALTARADIGLTGADLAIAETGSLVLRAGAGRPRSTSLLPPCHVAVFDRDALVESLAQAGLVLEAWYGAAAPEWRGGVVSFITGPSRTADIELTLTRGVHGPKEVHAIFVERGLRG